MFDDYYLETKKSWDLCLIILISLLLVLFILFIPDNLFRLIVGLMFILIFPGYAIIATIFPNKKPINMIERFALSVGLSIAIVPLIGFGLNFTPFGIRLEPILFSLVLFNLAFCLLAMWRRSNSNNPFLPFNPCSLKAIIKRELYRGTKIDQMLTIVLVIAILFSVMALVYAMYVPREGEHYSEFYILGKDGMATNYPHNISIGVTSQVLLGIANHEYRTVNYTVEVWLTDSKFVQNSSAIDQLLFFDSFSIVLNHSPSNADSNWTPGWEKPYDFSPSQSGEFRIWFVLLIDNTPFKGVKYQDYTKSFVQDRFMNIINSKESYILNLNVNIYSQ